MEKLDRKQIENLLPHREPMLLIDELTEIKKLHSATAIMNVKKDGFYVNGHFPGQPVMPGVLIVEAFGQAAAALTAHGIDKENKIASKKNVLSKEDFKNEVQAFSEEVKKYNKGRKEKINKTNNQNNEKVVKLLKKINSILIDYSKENSISTTLDKKYVIMTKSENDITEKILEILNK